MLWLLCTTTIKCVIGYLLNKHDHRLAFDRVMEFAGHLGLAEPAASHSYTIFI